MSLAKVEKLLRLALGTDSDHEASAAALAAVRLMRDGGMVLTEKGHSQSAQHDAQLEKVALRNLLLELEATRAGHRAALALLAKRPTWNQAFRLGLAGVVLGAVAVTASFAVTGVLDGRAQLARCAALPDEAAP